MMRTLWSLKACETELPPLGSSEDNLGETSSAAPQTVHQSSETKLLEWAQGCSEAHWTGSSQSEPVLNQTRPLIDELNQRYFISIPNMKNAKRGGTIRTTQCQIHRACLMVTLGPCT